VASFFSQHCSGEAPEAITGKLSTVHGYRSEYVVQDAYLAFKDKKQC